MTGSAKYYVTLLVLVACGATFAQQEKLPRGAAPIALGMSQTEFEKITGAKPEPCLECITHEDRYLLLKTKGIFQDPSITEGADPSFFRGRLYRLGVPFEEKLKTVLPKYRGKYGPEKRHVDWGNGISAYIWEDSQTRLEIHHGTKDSKSFALFFEDKELRQQLEAQYEKDKKAGINKE